MTPKLFVEKLKAETKDCPFLTFTAVENIGCLVLQGYWDHKSTEEGGTLSIVLDAEEYELVDFDGAFRLPAYVTSKLLELGVTI